MKFSAFDCCLPRFASKKTLWRQFNLPVCSHGSITLLEASKVNKKERVHAALEGKPVDQLPVSVPYIFLYHLDHFGELTGLSQMQSFAWKNMDPVDHTRILKQIIDVVDFDILQPQTAPSRQEREEYEYRELNGNFFRIHKKTGETIMLNPISGHAFDEKVNELQLVFNKDDAREKIKVTPAEKAITNGLNDYLQAAITTFGEDYFILSGGVLGTFYGCVEFVGLTNLFYLAAADPELVDYMCKLNLDRAVEYIRMLAQAGGDAIYIDDATTTQDMISRRDYERFSLPYIQEMVSEIHSLGHKAIVIYFGGIQDRAELIASTGADGLIMETSMKNYINNIAEIAVRIGKDITLFGNVDPIGILQDGSDEQLETEIQRQVNAGKQARGFILSTGSPITPATPLTRVRHFIDLGRSYLP